MTLTNYRTLGRSGLIVSPLALGTMTFGTARWGLNEAESADVFNAYVDAGGNFVDTADVYAGGRSEEMLGIFIAERNLRDQIILATKAGFAAGQGVHTGGNGAKHLHAALDGSLRRLQTDYVDLFWIHVWDSVTPAEELLETMTGLQRAGKIRYWGMSNAPAWYVAKLATLAAVRGVSGPIALQYFYSLVNRDIEDEHVPVAKEFGLGIVPWSPLAYGLLTGKYDRATVEAAPARVGGLPRDAANRESNRRPEGDKRLDGANPFGDSLFTPRNWKIVDELKRVSTEAGESPARIALAWVCGRPGITSTLLGVSRSEQVRDNTSALDIVLSADHRAALDVASTSADPRMLYSLFTRHAQGFSAGAFGLVFLLLPLELLLALFFPALLLFLVLLSALFVLCFTLLAFGVGFRGWGGCHDRGGVGGLLCRCLRVMHGACLLASILNPIALKT